MERNRHPSQFIYLKQAIGDESLIKIGQSSRPLKRHILGFSTKYVYSWDEPMADTYLHARLLEDGIIELPNEKFQGNIDEIHGLLLSYGLTVIYPRKCYSNGCV